MKIVGRLLSYPRAIFNIFFIPFHTLFCSAFAVLIFIPILSYRGFDKYIRAWAWVLCWVVGIKIHVKGAEKIQGMPAMILVSNHLALFDIPVLYLALPVSFRMAAKSELFRIPVFGQALKKGGFLPIYRHSPMAAREALAVAGAKFARGESLWMAPEGTRFKGEGVGEFKMGAFQLSLQVKQPIVPICIYGTHKVLPKNSILTNWGRWSQNVQVRILDPVDPKEWGEERRHALRDHVRSAIVSEFSQCSASSASSV
jgi:1-acyl-sn-glycerol-3-phosphate acyltransferase